MQPEEAGEFAKAPEEVLKARRIIKPRRAGGGLASTPATPAAAANGAPPAGAPAAVSKSSNPFAGVSLLAPKPQAALAAQVGNARAACWTHMITVPAGNGISEWHSRLVHLL